MQTAGTAAMPAKRIPTTRSTHRPRPVKVPKETRQGQKGQRKTSQQSCRHQQRGEDGRLTRCKNGTAEIIQLRNRRPGNQRRQHQQERRHQPDEGVDPPGTRLQRRYYCNSGSSNSDGSSSSSGNTVARPQDHEPDSLY